MTITAWLSRTDRVHLGYAYWLVLLAIMWSMVAR